MATTIKRRNFLKNTLLASGGILLATNFISCNDDDEITNPIPDNLSEENFKEGVASFDPTNSQVIIWTRYTTDKSSVAITWQVATDIKFKNIVRQSEVITDASRDYTIAIEVKELAENQKLYYRFINIKDKTTSVIGETLTFGTKTSDVKLAVTSCANYAYGYFNVYEAINKSEAEVVVHLGDYIYEYGENTYGSFRTPNPKGEIISLDDYRTRYRQYRSDNKLKELHQKKPFICIWDDHEVANDSYKDGAENHQENEGSYTVRKNSALQAYSEYLPNTTNIVDNAIIYRNLKIGNLADLILLDTRIIGREKQLNYADFYTSKGEFDIPSFQKEWLNPNRTMLGTTQKTWVTNQIKTSNASWQIIGQQVLMGKMLMPAELLPILARVSAEAETKGGASAETFGAFQKAITELVIIKTRFLKKDPSLTPQEIARIKTVLPYNLDAWDGYFMEREALLASFKNKKVVVLAGDTHNAWQSDLTNANGDKVGVELATSSVSSPGLEKYLGEGALQLEKALQLLVDDLKYSDFSQRGFMELHINQASVVSNWKYVSTVISETYTTKTGHSVTV
ncbi:alkaline phosphatase D family protein [Tenacibaculum piscium]|uniref:Alkaline phosphatase n=1 Tax=Tenacibaculum piscium TaxID=1458515 RepID=A0A2H1YI54_9FLAO|nr:alkaline phosphatase D family protein [Tenacibaculum piscium]MBE7629919.1 alkaline phosphatase [Tenacibaculum piscium]MBE7670331.1 alkaline phosphatase [Tenacibaculum piscium]MBE7690483.1 alkaline phosphatase [Tenacibaculum piscium]SOS75071.1 Alkaline phosphatase [Tenacibaculum piscium]